VEEAGGGCGFGWLCSGLRPEVVVVCEMKGRVGSVNQLELVVQSVRGAEYVSS